MGRWYRKGIPQMSDLLRIVKPLPRDISKGFVKQNWLKKLYLSHTMVEQYLLATLGPFSFEVLQPIYDDMPPITRGEKNYPAIRTAIVAAICKLTVNIDGKKVIITEIGSCPNIYDAEHNGQRFQQAASMGLVRCSMRLGLGLDLHMDGEPYFLYSALQRLEQGGADSDSTTPDSAETERPGFFGSSG